MTTFSIIQKSQLEGANRLDAEYYQPEYLNTIRILDKKGAKPLNTFLEDIRYGLYTEPNYQDIGVNFIRGLNLLDLGIGGEILKIEKKAIPNNNYFLRENDILIARSGSVGAVGIIPKDFEGSTFGSYTIRTRVKNLNPNFLYIFLKTQFGKLQVEKLSTQVAQPNINIPSLKALKIPLLPTDLQEKISAYVSKIYTEIAKSESLYQQAENLLLRQVEFDKIDFTTKPFYVTSIRESIAGQFSLFNLPDVAFVEERIKIQKIFRKYVWHGTPDIRVIVFNKVPVMAMLRLPTPQSKGKANLYQGAVGVGIDLATGITTHGVVNRRFIKYIPGTKRKVNGLKIPEWSKILTLAVRVQEAVPSLGYLGVDIVLDKLRGPMILELNARPGLEIQNANFAPLKKRLERVEGLEVRDAEQGVRISKTLFAERFADRVMAEEGIKIVNVFEEVKIRAADKSKVPVLAKIDTGAWRTSIDKGLASQLGLLRPENVLWKKKVRSALGETSRPVINLTFYLARRRIKTVASVSDRGRVSYPLLIGRQDLQGFLVRPGE